MGEHHDHTPTSGRERGREGGPRLSDDGLYDALASTVRRRLLYLLLIEEETTVDRIATVLVGWDTAGSGTMATPDDRERIVLELEHNHLPCLDDNGFIDYESEDGRVSVEPLADPVVDLIRRSIETERSPDR
jgi:hypothetical protein